MEFVKRKCKKCGYELEVPDSTTSVICGSCGEINTFGRLASLLGKQAGSGFEIKREDKIPGTTGAPGKPVESSASSGVKTQDIRSIPSRNGEEQPLPDEGEDFPEQKSATKIMTLIFILAPFIAMAVEFFKLPPYAVFIVIAALILIVFLIKKRS